jgi:murein DD-endopeptidase MepM/ murein hydrolase activator NlpD
VVILAVIFGVLAYKVSQQNINDLPVVPTATPVPGTPTPAPTPKPSSGGTWVTPVAGARRSAGTWYYSSGGVHLGADYAAAVGTTIRAAGNGVVLKSADGCTVGYLGSTCAGYGGSSGGGNQVYLLTKMNGSMYVIKYLHMQAGTPIATGTIVSAGEYIGRVGATGNVTGPHTHVEVFYLGDSAGFSNFALNWNGDLAFGCGWYYNALNRLCENGVGAPCRVRPETIFY